MFDTVLLEKRTESARYKLGSEDSKHATSNLVHHGTIINLEPDKASPILIYWLDGKMIQSTDDMAFTVPELTLSAGEKCTRVRIEVPGFHPYTDKKADMSTETEDQARVTFQIHMPSGKPNHYDRCLYVTDNYATVKGDHRRVAMEAVGDDETPQADVPCELTIESGCLKSGGTTGSMTALFDPSETFFVRYDKDTGKRVNDPALLWSMKTNTPNPTGPVTRARASQASDGSVVFKYHFAPPLGSAVDDVDGDDDNQEE